MEDVTPHPIPGQRDGMDEACIFLVVEHQSNLSCEQDNQAPAGVLIDGFL